MHVVVCSPNPSVTISIEAILEAADISGTIEPSFQEFGSLLYRDPTAIGLFWTMGPASATETCRHLRMADVRNSLFAVIEAASDFTGGAPGRAMALHAGADDVQPWPLHASELVARLFALDRRKRAIDDGSFVLPGGCLFHPAIGQIVGRKTVVHLSRQEAILLQALVSRPGMLVTKPMCMLALYNGRDEAGQKIIDVYICKLRKKIAAATGGIEIIESVWGQGYRFNPEGFAPVTTALGNRAIA